MKKPMRDNNDNEKDTGVADSTMDPELTHASNTSGVIRELGELPEGALITEQGLAKIFNRHQVSIKRAVQRGELPAPTRLFGMPTWTAGNILRHIKGRQERAAKEKDKIVRNISELRP